MNLTTHPKLALFIILAATAVIYHPALLAPFYLDDFGSIVNNPLIQTGSVADIFNNYQFRALGYLSFAANYYFDGLDVQYFHAVNILIHLINGVLVFSIVRLLAPFTALQDKQHTWLAILAASLFLLAPLNTQAVVYIVQRLALLVCLFYLLGIYLYLKFRLAESYARFWYFSLFLLCVLLGLNTKQNFVTLPLALVALELLILKSITRRQLINMVLAVFSALLIIQVVDFVSGFGIFEALDNYSRETAQYSRWEYFTHQLPILFTYIYKFIIPYPLLLEYGLYEFTWDSPLVWASLAMYGAITWLCTKNIRSLPVLVFFVAFYFIAHLVESSFLPITDIAVEHRSYLPNAGLATVIAYLLIILSQKSTKVFAVLSIGILVAFSGLTMTRLILWQEPMEFYRHELRHTHDSSRAYMSVAIEFAKQGNLGKARRWFRNSLKVGQDTQRLQAATIVAYIELLHIMDEEAEAKYYGIKGVEAAPSTEGKADILAALAAHDVRQGQCDFAMGMINRALRIYPNHIRASFLKQQCELAMQNSEK